MVNEIRFFELNTGSKIPSIGLGTWLADHGVVSDAIAAAIKVGYRHIDCAQIYGNQKEIGSALKKLFEEGVVKREDLWITSKLWCTDHAPEDVPKALDQTLRELQLGYVDEWMLQKMVLLLQERLLKGNFLVHETYGENISEEELWDGDI